jgi:hypothetical protein
MAQAATDVQQHDHAKADRIDAEVYHNRQKYRHDKGGRHVD